ncbi:amidohydrolase [Aestuariirhabdus sp. Z084]|uniref:amidohydrolase n=1 Tax=Aestuariirhabdus haliotis TaxID=2918751 RepID=UPI0020BDEDBB|nr:amidohydrolase [Aestuariirhabdus haliotis]MCL6416741.1 amidohydrolase [Aestuariirhabdus haliotis]
MLHTTFCSPRLFACLGLFFTSLLLTACNSDSSPDTLLINGNILTVDEADRVVEAIALSDNLITAVGSQEEMLALASDDTEIIDLNGQTLIPGFVAAHEHPTLTAVFSGLVDLSGFNNDSAADMWSRLQQEIDNTPKGEWVFAMGLDPILMPDLKMPDRAFLDQIAPDNPLLIIAQSMHSFWANSQAFEAVGIDSNTPDPGHGSYYGRDANGELNGFMSESAVDPFMEPLKSPLRVINRYELALQSLLESGITSVASLGFNVPPLLARYAASDQFQARIRQFVYLRQEEIDMLPDSPDNGDDFYRILGIKLWHDGSPYTGSMYLSKPYLTNKTTAMMGIPPGHRGEPVIDASTFKQSLRQYSDQGWQLAVHSQGDLSNEWSAQAFEEVLGTDAKERRHRFEHGVLLPKRLLDQFARLGLTPSFHINHIYYYGDALRDKILGPMWAQQVLPVKAAFERGLRPSLHADTPMFPANPLSLMQTAVTRKTSSGQTLGLDQAITPQQALRAVTINAAWQLHMEDKIGSIEVGKQADLTLLSANPYQLPAEQWSKIKVQQVWLAGQTRLTE